MTSFSQTMHLMTLILNSKKSIDIFRNFTKSAMVTKMQNKESIMCTHLNLVWTEGAQNIQQFGMSSPKISWVKVKLVQVYLVI